MTFEIMNGDGKRVFVTENKTCIPSEETLKQMSEAKYKFKLDGKTVTKKRLRELLNKKVK